MSYGAITGNSKKPCGKFCDWFIGGGIFPQINEHLFGNITRFLTVTGYPVGKPINLFLMPYQKLLERAPIIRRETTVELFVGDQQKIRLHFSAPTPDRDQFEAIRRLSANKTNS